MRTIRQGPIRSERGDDLTIQQLMENFTALQESMTTSKAEQAHREEQFRIELDASRVTNDELRKTNEELHRDLQSLGERSMGEQIHPTRKRTRPMPFSQAIMEVEVPMNFVTPKIMFTGTEYPEAHLKAFHAQMMILGGTDAMHCKLLMGTFTGTTLRWFIGLPDGHITSSNQFSTLFREQFIVNQAPPLVPFDLFEVKQRQGEPLKDFLNRFGAFVAELNTQDEALMLYAFVRGVVSGAFGDSLIRS